MPYNYAIIGAHRNDEKSNNSGAAYIFHNMDIGWTQVTKLLASDGQPDDRFGFSVSISGDHAIVGAPYDDDKALLRDQLMYITVRPLDGHKKSYWLTMDREVIILVALYPLMEITSLLAHNTENLHMFFIASQENGHML